ncbi:MAG: TIGR03936 family radical SAM-associated protein [Candidatus Omnitrophota bacterium]|nr:TIGR03936 family radical SAM-associated protein [Candidatus Omnitrophota bacterium]
MNMEKFPLKVIIYKEGEMIYFSQLDLAKILERAIRRTGLPFYYTQGFRPHLKISFGRALKLGIEGAEDVIFYFTRPISPQELRQLLLPQLPQGLTIKNITV